MKVTGQFIINETEITNYPKIKDHIKRILHERIIREIFDKDFLEISEKKIGTESYKYTNAIEYKASCIFINDSKLNMLQELIDTLTYRMHKHEQESYKQQLMEILISDKI